MPALKCDAKSKEECNDKEKTYIDKMAPLDGPAVQKELDRLTAMAAKKGAMTAELLGWLERRVRILEQLVKSKTEL